ncbi:MAG: hypothetical protein ACK4K7_08135 [Allosphingosinicella sp.]|uniref:hypothetical protein n=1 Tax=Allosphingosinicella sp. TaxID=2823234 RepID=UPI003926FD79
MTMSMPTGRLQISRGHERGDAPHAEGPRLRLVGAGEPPPAPAAPAPPEVAAEPAPAPAPATLDYHLVHDRLTALERLSRLHEQGALSSDEFAAEKAAILRLPAEELVLRAPAPTQEPARRPDRIARPRGPSLLSRLFSWKFLPVGAAAGLALSWYAQPRETVAFLEQAARYLGA